MADKLPILERRLETFQEQHNQKLNTIIGKISVPAMQTRDPMVMECHRQLIDLAVWVDEQFEGLDESSES
jgi:hypothetical protein